ncbi:MAG: hypothetical protein XD93_0571 [candidate division WS6 bacterium 34_10]|jgi:rubrerythrin|uniref:Rubrerythrin rubredoxin-like domain-containing protein n=1 Tax=candidate division WS6 bacterium 34_10 TaxID=1641389 RepID=A0A124FX67_9BACT|nr:MAG: hypothetical protein XD93_0571 [candidate division WS6 bacterium 34_10]
MQELKKSNGSNSNTSSLNTASAIPIKENTSLNPEDLDERWLRWKCLKCGFVYEGVKPINVCPKCGNDDPDLFVDAC